MDVIVPAVAAYESAAIKGASFQDALARMADAAENGRESTRDLLAKVGRASRLGERSRGVLDAGATSGAIVVQAIGIDLGKGSLVTERFWSSCCGDRMIGPQILRADCFGGLALPPLAIEVTADLE